MTVEDVFEALPRNFDASEAGDLHARIQFELLGDGGGDWLVEIRGGKASARQEKHESPNLTLKLSAADYLNMIDGNLDPMQAFTQGRLQFTGDMALAMQMQGLFKRPA